MTSMNDTESTSARIRSQLERAMMPLTSAQLSEQLDLREPVVRHHLRRMHANGSVVEITSDTRAPVRGRPPRAWRVTPSVDERAVARVAAELARALHDDEPALEDRMHALGRSLASDATGPDVLDALHGGLARLGFAPRRAVGERGRERIVLDGCPFASPERGIEDTAICHVHRLIAEGMCPSERTVDHLDIDPSGVGCVIHLRPGTS